MVKYGLLVRLEARPGKEAEVEALLHAARAPVEAERGTAAWFALRFGPRQYGVLDVFPDEAARQAHLDGAVAHALLGRADELFARRPAIEPLEVLADKLPSGARVPVVKNGVLLHFRPRAGKEGEVERFLRAARAVVEDEPGTTAWFAIHLQGGEYGIFDVFPSPRERRRHLTGGVPRALVRRGLPLLGSLPRMELPQVVAEKLTPAVGL